MINGWEEKEVRIAVDASIYGPIAITIPCSTGLTGDWRKITHVATGRSISHYYFSVEKEGDLRSLEKTVEEMAETLDWNSKNIGGFYKKREDYEAKIEEIVKKHGVRVRY